MILNHRDNLFISVVKIYATAQLTPRAVPITANTAEARFHRNLTSLALFSFVIILSSMILIVLNLLGTEIHGFSKTQLGSALIFSTALRGYGLLAQVHGLVCFSAVMSRVYTLV